jgi:hypothetical protein
MPWPERIYEGLYRISADSDERAKIPRFYSTQIQVMVNSLNRMPVSENKLTGSEGISVLMANSLMFQSYPEHKGYEDPQFANFYGQALPFVKRGIPVKTLHIENVAYPETWKGTKILIMSYSNMKPLGRNVHNYIADWVRKGGILVYCGRDNDPFQTVREWWNQDGNSYKTPSAHLFELMKMEAAPKEGEYAYGQGTIRVIRRDPKEFVLTAGQDESFVTIVKQLYEQKSGKGTLLFKNNFYLERGPFDLASVMDESVSREPLILTGLMIDLFDPALPVITEKKVDVGEQAYLYNLARVPEPGKPQVLAAASRVYEEEIGKASYSFVAKSPENTTNVMRILLPEKPKMLIVTDKNGQETVAAHEWDERSKTCLLEFENEPEGIHVKLEW